MMRRSKTALKIMPNQLTNIGNLLKKRGQNQTPCRRPFLKQFWDNFGSIWDPCWDPVRSQSHQNRSQEPFEKSIEFSLIFEEIPGKPGRGVPGGAGIVPHLVKPSFFMKSPFSLRREAKKWKCWFWGPLFLERNLSRKQRETKVSLEGRRMQSEERRGDLTTAGRRPPD